MQNTTRLLFIFTLIGFISLYALQQPSAASISPLSDSLKVVKVASPEFYKHIGKEMDYPRIAREYRVEGKFFVSFSLTESGQIKDIQIVEKSTHLHVLSEIVIVAYSKNQEIRSETKKAKAIEAIHAEIIRTMLTFQKYKLVQEAQHKVDEERSILPFIFKLS